MQNGWFGKTSGTAKFPSFVNQISITQIIHVWYVYLRLVDFYGKCNIDISYMDPMGNGISICRNMYIYMGVPKIGVPQNGRTIMEIPTKMDDLGVPLFLETPIYVYITLRSPHRRCWTRPIQIHLHLNQKIREMTTYRFRIPKVASLPKRPGRDQGNSSQVVPTNISWKFVFLRFHLEKTSFGIAIQRQLYPMIP